LIPRRAITILFAAMACGEPDPVGELDGMSEPTTTGRLGVAKAGYEAEGMTAEGVATEAGSLDGEAASGQLT
jgi:hypothetical protein